MSSRTDSPREELALFDLTISLDPFAAVVNYV